MRTLMALVLLLLTAAPAPAQSVTLYPVPGGRPCDGYRDGKWYQHRVWDVTVCGKGRIRKAQGGKHA
jgi:hypothetical protein